MKTEITSDRKLTLEADGAEFFAGAVGLECLASIYDALADLPSDKAGTRINGNAALAELLDTSGPIGSIAARALGPQARAVRAIMFDKHAGANWSLTWHQDRTIVVRQRREVSGYGPWTVKSGLLHVAPDFRLLERMVTLRLHLDRVTPENAPLLIAPGSHRLGRVAEPDIEAVVARCGAVMCLAGPGDIWAYSTPILHASAASRSTRKRRVLQIDYSAEHLPGGLEWLGIG